MTTLICSPDANSIASPFTLVQRLTGRWRMELEIDPATADLNAAETLFGHPINFLESFNQDDLADLQKLAVLVDTRDDSTGKHAIRVGRLSRLFALQQGFPAGAADAIELAARLHDIGKVFVPDRILMKPGPLDSEERQIMEQHTQIGAQLLGTAMQPGRLLARLMARLHHEFWDGNGYPFRLPGERTPCIVRLVTVVDVFDALVNERPYKRAWDCETTLSWMLRQAGKQFDPELVRAFVSFIQPYRNDVPALLLELEKHASQTAA